MELGWAHIFVTAASMLFVSGITVGVLRFQAKELTRRLESMEDQMKQITQILVNQATQAVRLDTMDQRLNAQGARLDEAAKTFNESIKSMARMVEGVVSRVNNFIDDQAKKFTLRVREDGS